MKKFRLVDLYLIFLAVFGVIGAGLRSYALLTSFNSITMHFDEKIIITIANSMIAICALAFICYIFFGQKRENLIARTDNAASYIPAGLVSIAMAFMAGEMFAVKPLSVRPGVIDYVYPISKITAILAILSIVAFFLSILIQRNDNLYKAAFSLCIVFFLAFYAVYLFFNKDVHPTNSPNKITDQMAYLFSAVFFLYESRIFLGRAKWRAYVAFGLVSTLLCAYSAIPSLINYAVNRYVVSDSLVESILTLAIGLYIGSKVLQSKNLPTNTECPEAKSITNLAAIRQEEIEEQRKLAHEHNIINKEENDTTDDASNYTFDIPIQETNTESDLDEENPS